jgi:hypothetical protein
VVVFIARMITESRNQIILRGFNRLRTETHCSFFAKAVMNLSVSYKTGNF